METVLCACGCGKLINKYNKQGKLAIYKHGHNHLPAKEKIIRGGYYYILKKNHPFSGKQGYIAEHRLVMETRLGRYLTKSECVHHINGDGLDNRDKNLELCATHGEHTSKFHPEIKEKVRTVNTGRKPGNYNRGIVKCRQCSREFETTLGTSRKVFCSRECYWKNKKGKPCTYLEGLKIGWEYMRNLKRQRLLNQP